MLTHSKRKRQFLTSLFSNCKIFHSKHLLFINLKQIFRFKGSFYNFKNHSESDTNVYSSVVWLSLCVCVVGCVCVVVHVVVCVCDFSCKKKSH